MPVISLRGVKCTFQSHLWAVQAESSQCLAIAIFALKKRMKKYCQVHFKEVGFRSQIMLKPGVQFKFSDEYP